MIKRRSDTRLRNFACWLAVVSASSAMTCRCACAQTVNPTYASQMTLSHVVGVNPPGPVPSMGLITQMAMHPDGQHLFVASYELGIVRFDYSIDAITGTTSLTNAVLVWQNPTSDLGIRGSTGLAFHVDQQLGTVLYFNQAVPFIPGHQSSVTAETARLQTVRRMTDTDGDGIWGGAGEVNQAILNNVQVNTQHQINNFALRGDSLFMGIGTQTVPGNDETAYTGTISWIQDLSLLGDTTTPNLAGFDTPPGNGMGADGHHVDTRPFTSNDPSKLRVFSTGARNPFGVTIQGVHRTGDVWFSMNQQEEEVQGGVKPDEFHRTFHQADHNFPKFYQTDGNIRNAHLIGPNPPTTLPEQVGGFQPVDIQMNPVDDNITNWKTNPAAMAAGFFDPLNAVAAPFATLEEHVSANGFDFYYGSNPKFYGDAFVARWGPDDIRTIDMASGEQISIVFGLLNPLTVLRVAGGLLIADSNAIRFLRFIGDPIPGPPMEGDYNGNGVVDAADYVVWRKLDGAEPGYARWRANFGALAGNGTAALAHANVSVAPEPASIELIMLAVAAGVLEISALKRRRVALRTFP